MSQLPKVGNMYISNADTCRSGQRYAGTAGAPAQWGPHSALTCGFPLTCANSQRSGPFRPALARLKPFPPALVLPREHQGNRENEGP